MMPELIYCGGGGPKFAQIAIREGMKYGARLPDTIYAPPYFADQNWKNPKREAYMAALEKHKPKMATVLDLEQKSQLSMVLDWAEQAAQFVENVLIIPKVRGIVKHIPRRIAGKDVVLAYSVRTKYGSTPVSVEEFSGWQVHLLGGKPSVQIATWQSMSNVCDVVSLDGNYYRMKATRFCEYWEPPNKWIPDGGRTKKDVYYKVFERSVKNLVQHWRELTRS